MIFNMATNFAAILILINYICYTFAAPPIFNGLPTSVNVGELEYQTRSIYKLDVTDINNDPYVCNELSTTPTPNRTETLFRVIRDPKTGVFEVQVHNENPGDVNNPNPMFDFNIARTYSVRIRCMDVNGEFTSADLEVDLIAQDRLEFTDSSNNVQSINAQTHKKGMQVYQVASKHLLPGDVTYSLTSSPASNSFEIDQSGIIKARQDLIYETHSPYDLEVTVICNHQLAVSKRVTVTIDNLNSIPNITNLPATISIDEDVAAGTLLYTLTTQDLDTTDAHNYTVNSNPITGNSLFTFDPATKQLKLSNTGSFDYETTNYYNVTFTISDGKATTGPYVLNVNIRNVNEACFFDRSAYYITMNEESTFTVNPNFVVRDHDGTAPYSLSLLNANNSNLLSIDGSTGVISFRNSYDIDQNANPTSLQLGVICQDEFGLTNTTTLFITVLDVNDNAPVFNQGTYTFFSDQYTALGSLIGQVVATDKDSGSNAEFTCGGSLASSSILTNTHYTVGTGCGVYFLSRAGLSDGTVSRYLVTATDKGSPPRSSTTTVNLYYQIRATTTQPTTTTTTTTTAAPTTAAPALTGGEIAGIVIGSLVGAALLGLALYYMLRCCYTGLCCGPQPCDFMQCCRGGGENGCCRPQPQYDNYPRQTRMIKHRDTAEPVKFWNEETDSDFGGNSRKLKPSSREFGGIGGKREYPDFPYNGSQAERLSPSHVPVEIISRGGYSPGHGRVVPMLTY